MIKSEIFERLHKYDYEKDLQYSESRSHFVNRVVKEMNNNAEIETFIVFYREEEDENVQM